METEWIRAITFSEHVASSFPSLLNVNNLNGPLCAWMEVITCDHGNDNDQIKLLNFSHFNKSIKPEGSEHRRSTPPLCVD
jgi:hypothetical protein